MRRKCYRRYDSILCGIARERPKKGSFGEGEASPDRHGQEYEQCSHRYWASAQALKPAATAHTPRYRKQRPVVFLRRVDQSGRGCQPC
jgi:hypothetical protein